MAEHPKAHDEAPSVITDHPFEPRDRWWSLCKHCGLAQAAHSSSTINTPMEMVREHIEKYGEVRHADRDRKADLERQFREYERHRLELLGMVDRDQEVERLHEGGRVRIGYVSDDFPDDD